MRPEASAVGAEPFGVAVDRGLAVIAVRHGPPSGWEPPLQAAFAAAIRAAGERADVDAVVLRGPRVFGAPPAAAPRRSFAAVVEAVATCAAPVIACLEADASDAGLELALACAARVGRPETRIALSHVRQGVLPRHGGLQRLASGVDLKTAADLAVLGVALTAAEALDARLLDVVAVRDPVGCARRLRLGRGRGPAGARRAQSPDADLFAVRLELRRRFPDQAAPLSMLRALEAALRLPARMAAQEIDRLADELARHPQAVALAHAHAAEASLDAATAELWGPRLRWALSQEAVHLVDEGASPAQVDRALTAYGFQAPPFAESDRVGLARFFSLDGASPVGSEAWTSYSPTLDLMLDAGRPGGPGRPGWYRPQPPSPGACATDPDVEKLLEDSATFQRARRDGRADEGAIVERCLLAAINGAAKLLDDPAAPPPRALDAIWTSHLGFPRWRGGPLHQMTLLGGAEVVRKLHERDRRRPTIGPPAAALLRLVQDQAPPPTSISHG